LVVPRSMPIIFSPAAMLCCSFYLAIVAVDRSKFYGVDVAVAEPRTAIVRTELALFPHRAE
jgi:hypothetical protein